MPKSQPLGKQPRQHIDAYGGIKAGTSQYQIFSDKRLSRHQGSPNWSTRTKALPMRSPDTDASTFRLNALGQSLYFWSLSRCYRNTLSPALALVDPASTKAYPQSERRLISSAVDRNSGLVGPTNGLNRLSKTLGHRAPRRDSQQVAAGLLLEKPSARRSDCYRGFPIAASKAGWLDLSRPHSLSAS